MPENGFTRWRVVDFSRRPVISTRPPGLCALAAAEGRHRAAYDQVAARSQLRSAAQAPAPAANQIGRVVQQPAPLIGAVVNSGNRGNYGGGYDYGRYPRPGYYGPGPVYGYPYGG